MTSTPLQKTEKSFTIQVLLFRSLLSDSITQTFPKHLLRFYFDFFFLFRIFRWMKGKLTSWHPCNFASEKFKAELNSDRSSPLLFWNWICLVIYFFLKHNGIPYSSFWSYLYGSHNREENNSSPQTFQWPHEQTLLELAEFHPPSVFFLPPNVQCLLGIVSADWWAAAPEEEPPSLWWAEDGPCLLQPFLARIHYLARPAAAVYLKLFKKRINVFQNAEEEDKRKNIKMWSLLMLVPFFF